MCSFGIGSQENGGKNDSWTEDALATVIGNFRQLLASPILSYMVY